MSFLRNRNWRFKLERSMVSRSSRVILPKPVKTTFFTANISESDTRRKEGPLRTELATYPSGANEEDLGVL